MLFGLFLDETATATDTTDSESLTKSDDFLDDIDERLPHQRQFSDEDDDVEKVSKIKNKWWYVLFFIWTIDVHLGIYIK